MSVVILTTGVPGCGKTYIRCAKFLVDDFLINTNGIHISNFPVNVDEVSAAVFKKVSKHRSIFGVFRKKTSLEDIKKRIWIIPDDELQRWRSGVSGPWDYFSGVNLKYCHIAIDEIHNFINSRCSDDLLKKWDDFLGEVRHRGCTFEGLTQDIDQVDKVLTGRAGVRLELFPGEDLRDPYFKIKMADWYELKAAFLGSYHKTVFMFEKRKSGSGGRWVTNHVSRFLITPEYFKYYNSFNASLQEKEKGASDEGRAVEYEYQRRSKISLLFWFIRRNFFSLLSRFLIAGLLIWLCFCGGINFLINGWFSVTTSMAKSNSAPNKTESTTDKSSPVKKDSESDKKDGVSASSDSGKLSESERKELKQEKKDFEDGFKPGLFFDNFCWLRNGIRIYEGFKFNNKKRHGDFYGKEVKKIDSSERNYVLDDGIIVDMF